MGGKWHRAFIVSPPAGLLEIRSSIGVWELVSAPSASGQDQGDIVALGTCLYAKDKVVKSLGHGFHNGLEWDMGPEKTWFGFDSCSAV